MATSFSTGVLLTSPDGITWTNRTLYKTTQSMADTTGKLILIYSVNYSNNQYVAVGDSGKVLISSDCITWTTKSAGTTDFLIDLAYGNNLYVAVGDSGKIFTSPIANAITYAAPKQSYSVIGNTMQIYTLQGKLIAQKKIESGNYFDGKSSFYKNLSKGMYIVRIPTDNAVISRRILVE